MQPRSIALARIDARLREDPQSLELALDRARILADLGRAAEAQAAYVEVLTQAPDHLRALTDFGAFLTHGGLRAAARTVLERAVGLGVTSAAAHANLGHVLFAGNEYEGARAQYAAALAIEPERSDVHQGMSYALTRLGRDDEALEHRRRGFAGHALTTAPYRGTAPPLDVLLVVCAAGGTLYTETLLDPRVMRTTTFVADVADGSETFPAVDIVFNAISDADRNRAVLLALPAVLDGVDAPVLNAPQHVLGTARAELAARLATLDGVVTPRTVTVPLRELRAHGAAFVERAGFAYPLLVRAPGFHTGQHFARVDVPAELDAALAEVPGPDALLIAYCDTRGADGRYRKYRMMAIGGVLHPLHVAVSAHWKVHYFTADMASDAANRAEDERFLNDPEAAIGEHALRALARVVEAVALDYMGIDFGIDAGGNVVVFEANATMIVLPPGPEEMWDYRRAPVERIVAAVRTLLLGTQ